MNCEQAREEMPGLVLGALDSDQRGLVLEHLRGCEACARELRSLLPLRDALNHPDPSPRLPNGFTERLVGRIGPAGHRPRRRASEVLVHASRALAAAAVLLIALLGVGLHRTSSELARQVAYDARMSALMSRSDVVPVDMRGYRRGARGRLYVSPDRREGVLMLGGLPGLPDGKTYQLWLVSREGAKSVGTFTPLPGGSARLYLRPPHGLDAYERIDITIEPDGGSPRPTGKWVLAGRLT